MRQGRTPSAAVTRLLKPWQSAIVVIVAELAFQIRSAALKRPR
ncbi:hypothetical protein BIWAKO_02867 [Bosea sp. BIWAKO-01]|nr:hypothetical protein BIWAKO_02867 [Bosea sp. BIWAKO-01]